MKAKVICEKSDDYNKEYDVRRINYDQVIVTYPSQNGMKTFDIHEVELISECEKDDFILDHKYILKIKIPRGVGSYFYKILVESIENEINEKLTDINLLKDIYTKPSNRGIWHKEILLQANNKLPLDIKCSGHNFKRNGYDVTMIRLNSEDFKARCEFEIEEIQKQIKKREILIDHYKMALECDI